MVDRAVWGRMRWGRFRWGHTIMNTLDPAKFGHMRFGAFRFGVTKSDYPKLIKKLKETLSGM